MSSTNGIFNSERFIYYLTNSSLKHRIYRHICLVSLLAIFTLFTDPLDTTQKPTFGKILFFVFLLLIIYTNMYLLIPKFLFKNKYLQYFYGVCCYIIVGILTINIIKTNVEHVGNSSVLSEYQHIQFIPFIFIMLVFLAASTAIKLFQQWIKDSQRINDLEKTTMHIELEQLKNQINPHFLFNMLNNASVLTQKNPQKASQLLISLSDLLRYQLYDSTRSKVLLVADIQFITDFLNLEKTRRDNFEFRVNKKGDISGIQIPPLI